jgi:hypothetical protein
MDLETFMKQNQARHADLDKELDKMMEEDDDFKEINKQKGTTSEGKFNYFNYNIKYLDELDALENSDEDEKKAQEEADLEKQINAPDIVDNWEQEVEGKF